MTVYETPTDWRSTNWWRNRSYEERRFHAKVPPRHAHDFFDVQEPNSPVSTWVANYQPGKGLLLSGPSGSGKTYNAVVALNCLIAREKTSGRFLDADDYIEMLKDSFDSDGKLPEMYSTPHLIKYVKGVFDVLVLDGLGQERQTDFAKHELGSLIRHRYDHKLTTIITTHLSLLDLRNIYGDRVGAALSDMKQVTLRGR